MHVRSALPELVSYNVSSRPLQLHASILFHEPIETKSLEGIGMLENLVNSHVDTVHTALRGLEN